MRRTFNPIFLGEGMAPPASMVETPSLRTIEAVRRSARNAISIRVRDVTVVMGQDSYCAPLPYTLSWNLPPISFFVMQGMARQPVVRELAMAIRVAAGRLPAS
ncbi:hypothetical protein [Pseudorhodoferax sp.]|uniref:hypothetical protein n=1 Tax=Pseudorhodoferax sp. TaxID=1993553 RepID=UPI002DD6AE20|nr:hypothetical protein [Pseudorhodoferax sp.]